MKFIIYLVTVAMTILLTFNMGIHNGTAATLINHKLLTKKNTTKCCQVCSISEGIKRATFRNISTAKPM